MGMSMIYSFERPVVHPLFCPSVHNVYSLAYGYSRVCRNRNAIYEAWRNLLHEDMEDIETRIRQRSKFEQQSMAAHFGSLRATRIL